MDLTTREPQGGLSDSGSVRWPNPQLQSLSKKSLRFRRLESSLKHGSMNGARF